MSGVSRQCQHLDHAQTRQRQVRVADELRGQSRVHERQARVQCQAQQLGATLRARQGDEDHHGEGNGADRVAGKQTAV